METSEIIKALAAIAQESRLLVFRLLIQASPTGLAAGRISELTGIPPSSLSFHLKELSHAALVGVRHEGRFAIYSANFATMSSVLQYLTENCCGGVPPIPAAVPTPRKKTR